MTVSVNRINHRGAPSHSYFILTQYEKALLVIVYHLLTYALLFPSAVFK